MVCRDLDYERDKRSPEAGDCGVEFKGNLAIKVARLAGYGHVFYLRHIASTGEVSYEKIPVDVADNLVDCVIKSRVFLRARVNIKTDPNEAVNELVFHECY